MGRMFLAMNGKRINSLDDLRANFNPDQMLSFYRSGRLQKWLEECGATEELENINSIESGYDDAILLSMLMAVFGLSDEQIQAVDAARTEQVKQEEDKRQEEIPKSEQDNEEEEEEEKEEEYEANWNVCQLPKSALKGSLLKDTFEATTEEIALERLSTNKIITGTTQQNFISKAFFFDGYFWAKLCENGPFDEIWGKGKDGIHWTIDTELCELIHENCFGVERIKVTRNCVLLMGKTTNSRQYLVYTSDDGWEINSLDVDSIMNSPEYESDIEDVFAGDNCYGIACVRRWETGIFSKEYHVEHNLFLSDCLSSSNESDFKMLYDFRRFGTSDVKAYIFKERLFVLGGDYDFNFMYAELDSENPSANPLLELDGATVKVDDKIFVFDDVMFVVSKIDKYASEDERHKPIFTKDGMEWQTCEIDSDKVIDIVFDGVLYYAICEGEKSGHTTIYSSETCETWEELQDIVFSPGENESVSVAGNDVLILFNGSTTGKYILYSSREHSEPTYDVKQYVSVALEAGEKIQKIIAKEVNIKQETINMDTDLYSDLKLEEWRVRLLSFIIGDAFGVKFQENEMPTNIAKIANYIADKHFQKK